MSRKSEDPPIDVAIFGAGAAGAYVAYRLATADPRSTPALQKLLGKRERLDIRLFELGGRIGGRLWSHHFPELPGLPADLGGMGFTKVQQNVFGLCSQELGLKPVPFPPYGQVNIQYLRGRRFLYDQYWLCTPVPYQLIGTQMGCDPGTLVQNCLQQAIPGLGAHNQAVIAALEAGELEQATRAMNELTRFLRTARLAHLPEEAAELWRHGFWNMLYEFAGSEAYQLAVDSSYGSSSFWNFNLYDMVLGFYQVAFSFFYPDGTGDRLKRRRLGPRYSAPAFSLPGGYDELPKTMVGRFLQDGGTLHTGHRLRKLERAAKDGLIALTVAGPDGAERALLARSVVLAMPKRAIELLDADSVLFLDPQFRQDLQGVTPTPASKLFLTYDEPWWNGISPSDSGSLMTGYSTTDMPLRGIYYIGKAQNGRGLLLASLNDDAETTFWNGFRECSRYGLTGEPIEEVEGGLFVPPAMRQAAREQLAQVHGYPVPPAREAVFCNWSADPYGGGWHNWNPHLRSWEVMPRIRKPLSDLDIFLCGEAYSAVQGWVEGALNTAEMVVETYFGLPRPGWVLPDYEFGP